MKCSFWSDLDAPLRNSYTLQDLVRMFGRSYFVSCPLMARGKNSFSAKIMRQQHDKTRPAVVPVNNPDTPAQSFPQCRPSSRTATRDLSFQDVEHTANKQVRLHDYERQNWRWIKWPLVDAIIISREGSYLTLLGFDGKLTGTYCHAFSDECLCAFWEDWVALCICYKRGSGEEDMLNRLSGPFS